DRRRAPGARADLSDGGPRFEICRPVPGVVVPDLFSVRADLWGVHPFRAVRLAGRLDRALLPAVDLAQRTARVPAGLRHQLRAHPGAGLALHRGCDATLASGADVLCDTRGLVRLSLCRANARDLLDGRGLVGAIPGPL